MIYATGDTRGSFRSFQQAHILEQVILAYQHL